MISPSVISFHETSLSYAVGSNNQDGCVVFYNEETNFKATHKFENPISSLHIVDWNSQTSIIAGTYNGTVFLWDPNRANPSVCFRADYPAKCGMIPQLVSVQDKCKLLTSRGNYGTIKLWDIKTQKIIGEWNAGTSQTETTQIITALNTDPNDENLCVTGFRNGRIVNIDLRCPMNQAISNVNALRSSEKIIKIDTHRGSPNFLAASAKGSFSKWDSLESLNTRKFEIELTDFAAHQIYPLIAFSPKSSNPIITDFDFKTSFPINPYENCIFDDSSMLLVSFRYSINVF